MSSGKLTTPEAVALLGQRCPVDEHLLYPAMDPEQSVVDWAGLLKRLAFRADRLPEVDDTEYAPPVTFWDDFVSAGFAFDRALAGPDETDPEGVKFSQTADVGEWLVTVVDTGAWLTNACIASQDAAPGGILRIQCNIAGAGGAGDLVCAQVNGESFNTRVAAGIPPGPARPLYFETSFGVGGDGNIADVEAFIGLADSCTNAYGVAGIGDPDHVGFFLDQSGDVMFGVDEAAAGQSKVDTGADIVFTNVATWWTAAHHVRAGFFYDGISTIHVYINGVETCLNAAGNAGFVEGATFGGNVVTRPKGLDLSPVMHIETADAAQEVDLYLDYIAVAQMRL